METRLLKMFCTVADSGSLVKAAGRLHLTPSAISHGIKALEVELGCRLFERAGKKMLLNQAGEQLLAQVNPPLTALEAAAEAVKRLGRLGKTRMRIGASPSVCGYILPRVIRELKKTSTNLELQVESGNTPEMLELVRANKVDLALGVAPESHTGLDVRPIFKDELMFVFAPSHPWAAGRPISREELRSEPLIITQRSSFTARFINQFYHSQNLVPSTVMEIADIEAIKELVKLELGVSVLAPWTAEKELLRGSLKMRPLGTKPVTRNWVVLTLTGRRLTPEEETFFRLCRSHATGMRLDRKDVPA
jgi:LysR family transcriptional regulator, low CO2-responsive transcriptional regulator